MMVPAGGEGGLDSSEGFMRAAGGSFLRSRRRRGLFLDGKLGRRLRVSRRNKRCPGLAGFGTVLRGFPRNRRDADQVIAARALDFAPGKLFIALQVLFTTGTGKFEIGHNFGDSRE